MRSQNTLDKENTMKMSETISELANALAKAQGAIDDASKTTANPFFKSKYADLAAVRFVIREPLAVNDLAIIQAPRVVEGGAEVETMIIHKSGEFMSETLFMPAGKSDAHGYASAITYARRIGLMSLLCLASYDDDGNTAVESVKNTAPKKAASKELIKDGETAAKQGKAALTSWWTGLNEDDRNSISIADRDRFKKLTVPADGSDGDKQ
jgi:hypothetical protein